MRLIRDCVGLCLLFSVSCCLPLLLLRLCVLCSNFSFSLPCLGCEVPQHASSCQHCVSDTRYQFYKTKPYYPSRPCSSLPFPTLLCPLLSHCVLTCVRLACCPPPPPPAWPFPLPSLHILLLPFSSCRAVVVVRWCLVWFIGGHRGPSAGHGTGAALQRGRGEGGYRGVGWGGGGGARKAVPYRHPGLLRLDHTVSLSFHRTVRFYRAVSGLSAKEGACFLFFFWFRLASSCLVVSCFVVLPLICFGIFDLPFVCFVMTISVFSFVLSTCR